MSNYEKFKKRDPLLSTGYWLPVTGYLLPASVFYFL